MKSVDDFVKYGKSEMYKNEISHIYPNPIEEMSSGRVNKTPLMIESTPKAISYGKRNGDFKADLRHVFDNHPSVKLVYTDKHTGNLMMFGDAVITSMEVESANHTYGDKYGLEYTVTLRMSGNATNDHKPLITVTPTEERVCLFDIEDIIYSSGIESLRINTSCGVTANYARDSFEKEVYCIGCGSKLLKGERKNEN